MNKYTFKKPIVNLIVGVVLVTLAVLAMFVFDWISEFTQYMVGALIIAYTVLRFVSVKGGYKNSNARMILSIEAIVAITLGVLLIIGEVRMPFALGATLYMRGLVYLLILQLLNLRRRFETFIVHVAVLTLGAYVWFGSADLTIIEWLVFVAIAAFGLFLALIGLNKLR